MKTPKRMIEEYERTNPPIHAGGTRFYTYVRPRANGQSTIEIWSAVTDRTKARNLHCKWVMRFYTDSSVMDTRDLLFYSNWSCCAQDHFVVDWTEVGGFSHTNYMAMAYRADEKGKVIREYVTDDEAHDLRVPIATMLNGFGGELKWCAYTPKCGIDLREYIALYRINDKVELLSKAGLYHLINREFVTDMKHFPNIGKFLAKNLERARKVSQWRILKDFTMKMREESKDYVAYKKEEAERKARLKALAHARAIRDKVAKQRKHDKAINELYNSVKAICGVYESYEVVVPSCARDMVVEGELMHNCIGQVHPQYVANGSELCVFLHRNGKPCVDIAIDLKTYRVKECRLVCNKDADKLQMRIAENIAKRVREVLENRKVA